MMTFRNGRIGALSCLLLAACATPAPSPPAKVHLDADDAPPTRGTIPAPVQQPLALPKPKPATKTETYSVVVNNVKVQELLFALARDAKLNIDIHSGINGSVTLNAIDQTLPQLLSRIAKQVDLRWEIDGPNLSVMPDTPFLRNYRIDYVNMNRDTTSTVSVTSQVNSSVGGATGGGSGSGSNNSTTKIDNSAKNHFWETLTQNIKDILAETDKEIIVTRRESQRQEQTAADANSNVAAAGSGKTAAAGAAGALGQAVAALGNQLMQAQSGSNQQKQESGEFKDYKTLLAASVIANPETGLMSIRATSRQHEKIQEFLGQVLSSARRQVLVEATVAEVQLSKNYQQGIDWSRLSVAGTGFRLLQTGNLVPAAGSGRSVFELGYVNSNSRRNYSATIKLLENFGDVRVLSSPKISVLNNQTAVLKVVDNEVYFLTDVTVTDATTTTPEKTKYDTKVHSVPVGFVMNVTPQISDNDTVLLNIRPSISRKLGEVTVPNFNGVDVGNRIPIIRTRELESVIRVENGNIAVMGGLMEDSVDNAVGGVPGLSRLPGLGALFSQRNDTTTKTELVIFLRPVIVREASVTGDFRELRDLLPNKDFFANSPGPQQQLMPGETLGGRP